MADLNRDPHWLTASQAAARLGVKPATLYAYVSRGVIPRRRGADGRTSLFNAADVAKLGKRTPHSRLPPTDIVVPNAISLVDGRNGALWYRGSNAIDLATSRTFEAVAEFLWTGRWPDVDVWVSDRDAMRIARKAASALPSRTPRIDTIAPMLGAVRAAADDRDDRSPDGLLRTARTIMTVCAGSAGRMAGHIWPHLSDKLQTGDDLRLFDQLLVLGAEHGVTLSAATARIAASTGADLYSVVTAALAPGLPAIHRYRLPDIVTMLEITERTGDPEASVDGRDDVLGVSTDPYPKGDPRAKVVLASLRETRADKAAVVDALADVLRRRAKAEPDLPFATAAVAYAYGMASGSSELICLLSRMAGWIAHAMAEYRQPTPFRPHGTYTGPVPTPEQRDEWNLLHAVMGY